MTHAESDHAAGLIEVLQRYEVERVLYSESNPDIELYAEWSKLVQQKGIAATIAQSGQRIDVGDGVFMDVLNSREDSESSDANDSVVVLHLSAGRVSFLLASDITWQAEFGLLTDRAHLASTVLKVAHHGSDTSTTEEFLVAVDPRVAVISVGRDNRFGHPAVEVLTRLQAKLSEASIYRTDEQGAIEFVTDGTRFWVKD